MNSSASAIWTGDLKSGKGLVSAANAAFSNVPYTFAKRFEGAAGAGTTPEELIGAAHSACFAMASSGALSGAGFVPTQLDVTATVTLELVDGKQTVSKSHLVLVAQIPGIDDAKFQEIVAGAKAGCPISRLLKAEITLDAKLA